MKHSKIRVKHVKDDIFDISNSLIIGRTEVELMLDLYNGIKLMIWLNNDFKSQIENGAVNPVVNEQIVKFQAESYLRVQCGSHLKKAEDLWGAPVWPEGTKSMVSKHVTPELFNQLKDIKDAAGFGFR